MDELRFLRPLWLLGVALAPALAWLAWRRFAAVDPWRRACDPTLLLALRLETNAGAANARNRGASVARGEVLCFVDADVVVYRYKNRNTGEEALMSEDEVAASPNADEWEKGPLIQASRKGLFLEINGTQAAEYGMADATVVSRQELAALYNVRESDFTLMESTWVDVMVLVPL